MVKRGFSAAAALLAITAFALSPGAAQARGGHGGGGHGGGSFHSAAAFHGGGFHSGAAFHSGGFSGGHYYGGRGYYGRGWGWGGWGLGIGLGYLGYGYGYWPGYYGGGAYYDTAPSYPAVTNYNYYYGGGTPGYDAMPYADVTPPDVDYGASAQPAPATDATASISVIVPDGARVWFNGSATRQGGRVREFQSPPLTPGREFVYNVKAQWRDANGKEVTRTREVDVRAGANVSVDFARP
jgi:uncharacterized protein (TIGR03000 family)